MERPYSRIVLARIARLGLGGSPSVVITISIAFIVGLEIDTDARRFFGAEPIWLDKYYGLIDPHAYR